ncbi:MAG TPA: hypothetical protein VMZ74_07385 [Ramlibacter sp.]|nr:hypothetical protein [Ramlibacter sp.]
MAETPVEALGPEPFRFTPSAGSVEGPAFSKTFRIATTLFVLSLGFWLALVWLVEHARGGGTSLLVWFFFAFAMCVFFTFWILKSRTRIDSNALHQSWFADKHMAVADLATVGVLRVRGLEWLVAPRVHARTLMGKFAIFHAADPAVLAEFERLARELQAFRQR